MHGVAPRPLSFIFQLFYKIILAIYSRALKLVCRTADLESILEACRFSHYILCIIIMTIMRVYDRSAATDMFHTLSRRYFQHSNLGLANVLPCRVSREFPTSVTFSPSTSIPQKPARYCYLITFENFCQARHTSPWLKIIPIAFTHFCNNVQTCSYVILSLIKLLMRCAIVLLYAKYGWFKMLR